MSDELCPACNEPYNKKRELSTVTTYYHTPPKPNCDQYAMPGNPNKAESTPPDVLRRKKHPSRRSERFFVRGMPR